MADFISDDPHTLANTKKETFMTIIYYTATITTAVTRRARWPEQSVTGRINGGRPV